MSDILKLLAECNEHVNGACRTLACRQPDGTFSCPTKRTAARIRDLEREVAEAKQMLSLYRHSVPLGHQPHMLASEVDTFLARRGDGGGGEKE